MENRRTIETDVLVIGSGLAGITAAISAGQSGVSTVLVSAGQIFSGASFYPGTWGFGLIAPENDADADDLAATICRVGMGMANPELVELFVSRIQKRVNKLIEYGIPLKLPKLKEQREFIPCFDYKNRSWYGIIQKGAKEALDRKLTACGVVRFPHTEILKLWKTGDRVCGALGIHPRDGLVQFRFKSCVIASGGLGGLFRHALSTTDVSGTGQSLALSVGAKLINLEFHQMMPGFVSPCAKTIYNEKVFRFSAFYNAETGASIFEGLSSDEVHRLLEIRSGHGPFTSRLDSKEVDFRIFRRFVEDNTGVGLRYKTELRQNQPEFVATYFEWLKESKGLTIDDEVRLGIFYHASNGGIKIDCNAFTGVAGLFACGEATGGMHGADRLGGLSTANGLVFGEIAGFAAANDAQQQAMLSPLPPESTEPIAWICDAHSALSRLRQINFGAAMIFRSEQATAEAFKALELIKNNTNTERLNAAFTENDYQRIVDGFRLSAGLVLSDALLHAIRLRKESRGSHCRQDYPLTDAQYEHKIETCLDSDQTLQTAFTR